MLIPITCTCGRSLGDIYDHFDKDRRQMVEEKLEKDNNSVSPDKLNELSGYDDYPDITPLFNKYNINMLCCKRILLSNVNFNELLAKTHLAAPPTEK